MVLMPNNPRAGGISRRIEGEERDQLKESMSQLDIPKNMGVIVRTAGIDRSVEELQWDLNYLVHLFEAITKAADERSSPFLIYQESDVIIPCYTRLSQGRRCRNLTGHARVVRTGQSVRRPGNAAVQISAEAL